MIKSFMYHKPMVAIYPAAKSVMLNRSGDDFLKIAITEDRTDDGTLLSENISKWAAENNIPLVPSPSLYQSGEELLEHFTEGKYDVIFLDIYLKGMDGMETARQIRKTDLSCRLIFTTITNEFAVDSYDVDSSWYLLKPYSYEKLSQALARCCADQLEQNQTLVIPGKKKEYRILIHQIVWTEYINRQICIHLQNGENQYIRMRQCEFSGIMQKYPYFCDCMKGILVNLEFVEKMDNKCFVLKTGRTLPISRLKYENVRQKFLDYSFAAARSSRPICSN